MRYVSTRGQSPALSFEETMLTGLAPDGGLYVPEEVPLLDAAKLHRDDYETLAFKVMRPFTGDTFEDDEFEEIIARAYEGFGHVARAPLKQMDRGLWLMELFHGPTLAFKDFAMQLSARCSRPCWHAVASGSPSSARPAATPAARRSRRFAASTMWTSASSTRMAGSRKCSAAR